MRREAVVVTVGRIAGIFGIRGELKCDPTRAGRIVFFVDNVLECRRGDDVSQVRLSGVRSHGKRLLIRLDGVDGADAASAYAGATLLAPRDTIELRPDEFLDADLVGCGVFGADGAAYGSVEGVEHYPASDMLVVNGHFVPMVAAIVRSIDIEGRRIVIDPPSGLLD